MRLLIAGGGTGGHVFPALAVAEQLRAEQPASELLFVGSDDGLERLAVPANGFALETLSAGKLKGARTVDKLRTLAGLLPNVGRALRIVRRFSPQVVLGVGGYASAPVVMASWLDPGRRRPSIVLLEQNAVPGITNRRLALVADRVVVSHASSLRWFPAGRALHLGNPIRPALVAALQRQPLRPHPTSRCLLVMGGSQGARRINELCGEGLPALLHAMPRLRVLHQTGEADLQQVGERYAAAGLGHDRVRVTAFIDDTASAYVAADLVLGRAGATTLAELAVAGRPALLVPYPHAADDHQTENARALVLAGAARMVRQQDLDPARLGRELQRLLGDPALLVQMGAAMRRCARPEAAAAVVDLLRELAGQQR